MKKYAGAFVSRAICTLAIFGCAGPFLIAQQGGAPSPRRELPPAQTYTLTTTVNRVVLDVVVTDAHGNPVHGLSVDDFKVAEDGIPQRVLSFDTWNFDGAMDYTPSKLPSLPQNTFVDLPQSPERGPLYVILYDLVNIPNDDQIFARKQLVKFIENIPVGARFAIFVSSDGVHLVQGFTSNRQELFAAIDPKSSRPHVPEIFLMGINFGQNDPLAAATRLNLISGYLAGLPGRKNLIWMASYFPLSLFPSVDDTEQYRETVKKTLDLLASNQIAVYPVDVSGVIMNEVYAPPGAASATVGIATDARENGITPNLPVSSNHASKASGGPGISLTEANYMVQDAIAQVTGGKAIYSSNDVAQSLDKVTEDGGSYYTLTYSSTNKNYNGKLRHIHVELSAKGDHLSYRRAYYGTDFDGAAHKGPGAIDHFVEASDGGFSAEMEHGAPSVHQLIFAAHVRTMGAPVMGTHEQMADLASETTFLKVEHRGGPVKQPKSVPLQVYAIDYTVMAHQFQDAGGTAPDIAIAAAFYDADGHLLNASASKMQIGKPVASATLEPRDAYRVEQRLDTPLAAKFLRIAVRDGKTNKAGAMEISLPLAPESQSTH